MATMVRALAIVSAIGAVAVAVWLSTMPSRAPSTAVELAPPPEPGTQLGSAPAEPTSTPSSLAAIVPSARTPVVADAASSAPPASTIERARVVGRAIDESGAPLARVGLHVGGAADGARLHPIATDRRGRFVWTLGPGDTAPRVVRIARRNAAVPLTAEVELPPASDGTHDLGDVVLYRPPVLVRGRVVTPDGRPIGGAWVSVDLQELSFDFFDERHIETVRTEADGKFEVRGPANWLPVERAERLCRLSATGHARVAVEFDVGADLGDVVLAYVGGVSGALVLDPSWPADALEVVATAAGTTPLRRMFRSPASWIAALDTSGAFRFDDLPEGRYDLWLGGARWVGPLVPLWRDVRVEVGVARPTLSPPDWTVRGLVAFTELEVLDSNGSRRDPRTLRYRAEAEPSWEPIEIWLLSDDRPFVVAHRTAGVRLRARQQDTFAAEADCFGRKVVLQLVEAPFVQFSWADGAGPPFRGPLRAIHEDASDPETVPEELVLSYGLVRAGFRPTRPGAWRIELVRDGEPVVLTTVVVEPAAGTVDLVLPLPDGSGR